MKNQKLPLSKRDQEGFTLIELFIAIAISSIIAAAIYNLFLAQKKAYSVQEQVVETQQNARMAMHLLTKELRMTGYGIDRVNNQPRLVYCGPYQLTFNADLDSGRGTINTSLSPNRVPSAPAASFTGTYTPSTTYSGGAETVRWSLDSNDNGLITDADKDSDTSGNTRDFALNREEFGPKTGISGNGGTDVKIALGLRGPFLVDTDGDGVADANSRAMPLFQYWGEFDLLNGTTVYPDLDLYGDTDDDGSLSDAEIAAFENPPYCCVNGGLTDTVISATYPGETLDSVIKRIVITITAETLGKDPGWKDNAGYRKTILVSTVTPRNLEY